MAYKNHCLLLNALVDYRLVYTFKFHTPALYNNTSIHIYISCNRSNRVIFLVFLIKLVLVVCDFYSGIIFENYVVVLLPKCILNIYNMYIILTTCTYSVYLFVYLLTLVKEKEY